MNTVPSNIEHGKQTTQTEPQRLVTTNPMMHMDILWEIPSRVTWFLTLVLLKTRYCVETWPWCGTYIINGEHLSCWIRTHSREEYLGRRRWYCFLLLFGTRKGEIYTKRCAFAFHLDKNIELPVSCYWASPTYTCAKHCYIEYNRTCHRTNEHIPCVPQACEHILNHTPPHTCGSASVVQCTTHMHTHAMCAATITLTLTSTSCTIRCMRATHTHLHRHV